MIWVTGTVTCAVQEFRITNHILREDKTRKFELLDIEKRYIAAATDFREAEIARNANF